MSAAGAEAGPSGRLRAVHKDILCNVFRCLWVRDLGSVALVCRWWGAVAAQDDLWKALCELYHADSAARGGGERHHGRASPTTSRERLRNALSHQRRAGHPPPSLCYVEGATASHNSRLFSAGLKFAVGSASNSHSALTAESCAVAADTRSRPVAYHFVPLPAQTLDEELDRVTQEFYESTSTLSGASRAALITKHVDVMRSRILNVQQAAAALESCMRTLTTTSSALQTDCAETAQKVSAATVQTAALEGELTRRSQQRQLEQFIETFEVTVVRAVLSRAAPCEKGAGPPPAVAPLLSSFVDLEMYCLTRQHIGGAVSFRWMAIKRAFPVDASYYDTLDQAREGRLFVPDVGGSMDCAALFDAMPPPHNRVFKRMLSVVSSLSGEKFDGPAGPIAPSLDYDRLCALLH